MNKNNSKSKRIFRIIYMTIFIIFLYVPLAYIVLFSFNETSSLVKMSGFSFRWYVEMFDNEDLMEAIWNTISCAVISTIASTIIGTFGAIGLTKFKKTSRNVVMSAANFPVLNPDIVTAIGLLFVFLLFNFQLGYSTMLLAHISFCTPFVIITVYPKLKTLDSNTLEAAMDLGAKPLSAVMKVIIPQLKSAIFAAASMAFTMSFDDFIITYFASGTSVSNVSTYLYTIVLKRTKDLTVVAFSSIVILFIIIIVIARFIIDQKKYRVKKD